MGGISAIPGRGRPAKSLKTHILNGNPGKRKLNTDEPEYSEITDVVCPEWLSGVGKSMWKTIMPEVCSAGVICVTDIHNVEAFCSAYQNWREAQEDVMREGVTIYDEKGKKVKNPACTVVNEASRQMVMFGSLLGLDPSSRTRIMGGGNKAGKEENPYEGF